MGFGQSLGPSETADHWVTSFSPNLLSVLCFEDHMAPFRYLLRDNTPQEKLSTIQHLLQGQSHKVFVAVTGNYLNNEATRICSLAVDRITNSDPTNISPIQGSAWMIFRMKKKEDIVHLLTQRVIADSRHKVLIVFRCVAVCSLERIVEVRDCRVEGST
jgi:hypothetical protein